VYGRLQRWVGPSLASAGTCFLIFLILFLPIVFFVGTLTKEAMDLYQMARHALAGGQLQNLLGESTVVEKINSMLIHVNMTISGDELNRVVSELGKFVGLFLYEQANAIASNVLNFFVNFFFMLLMVYYLLIDGNRLIAFIIDLSPLPSQQDQQLIRKFKDMSGAVLIGNGLAGLVQGFLGGVVFAVFGIKNPFLWGVIMGLLAFLPIIGIGAVFVPAAIYLFLQGQIGAGVFFLIFYALLSGGMEYFAKPKLVGHKVKMHTLVVFLSIIGGLKLFGILGIIYGPLVVTAFMTLTEIYRAGYQKMVEAPQ
jgi:predicted PurR-regulated permease PerM